MMSKINKFCYKLKSKTYRILIPLRGWVLRRKRRIKVVFLFSNVSMWKNEALYRLMSCHSRFDPIVIIVPDLMLGEGKDDQLIESESFLHLNKYRYINPFKTNPDSASLMLRKFKPDIIFYPRPYNSYPMGYRFEDNFRSLFCYSNYGYHTVNNPYITDTVFINHLWHNYYESEVLKNEVVSMYPHLAKNIKVTGLPNTDTLLGNSCDQWIVKNKQVVRIIWAPHFSIERNWLNYSNFTQIADDMLALVRNTSLPIQIAFKPHPLLKYALYKHHEWGQEKTEWYFSCWTQVANGQLIENDYTGLFMHSDAMIHDCSSFIVEYLNVNKPVMFLVKEDKQINEGLWGAAQKALECHYMGQTIEDIKHFICDVVINKNDPKEEDRVKYFQKYLLPPNGKSASENIINVILGE